MENIKTFFLILFFSKSVLLTPVPIELNEEWIEIKPNEPFSAITSGATVNVQVPVDDYRVKDLEKGVDAFSQLEELFPDGSIEAVLVDENNKQIALSNSGFSVSDFEFKKEGSLWIPLFRSGGIPTNVDFRLVKIRSKVKINGVKVIWKNYKH